MKTIPAKVARTIAIFYLAAARIGFSQSQTETPPVTGTNSPVTEVANVHSITLPHFEPEMPAAPGRDEFLMVCESCHSPRYVTMQPSFARQKWEETVAKMARNYGAQMDEEQKQAIVGYLAAIKSNQANEVGTGSGDEESDSASAAHLPHYTETFPMIKPATNSVELAADLSRGADLFKQDCAACHGASGRGDGFIAQVLLRKPASLAATRFSSDFLSQVLWNGVRGTSMPSWRSLPQSDLRAISAYVQTLHSPVKTDEIPRAPTGRAMNLFQINCAPCHGVQGDGKSALAATLTPPPANFKRMQPDVELILQFLRDGIPGTAMPSWKEQLPDSDRAAIAEYVRSLYEPAASRSNR